MSDSFKRLDLNENSVNLLNLIVRHSKDAIISKDLNSKILSWNKAAEKLFDYSESEIIGKSILAIFPSDRRHEELEIISRISRGELIEDFESVRINKNGELLYVSITISPIQDKEGKVLGASTIVRDISACLEAEKNYSHFKALVDSSDDAIISKDLNGVITSWNKAAEKIFGFTAQEMIGKSMLKIFPEHKISEEAKFLKKIAAGQRIENYETVRLTKDKELINVSVTISPIYLRGKIIGASKIARDVTKQAIAQEKIWQQAHFDALTFVPNRKYFLDELEKAIISSTIQNDKFAIMFIDLDNFKLINDSYGHTVGDKVIVHVANVINSLIRDSDLLARLGGDEFVLLMSIKESEREIYRLGERILRELMSHSSLDDNQIIITVSIGVAIFPDHGLIKEDLMRRADHAMYQSKSLGKNQISIFNAKQNTGISNSYALLCDLRGLDCEKEMVIFYQPIVDVKTRKIIKAEALVRWEHPQYGLLPPSAFISLAEEYGLIQSIDRCVAQKALEQLAKWLPIFGEHFQICLNKSPRVFKSHSDNPMELNEQLSFHGLSAKNVVLEITEDSMMNFNELNKNKLENYQKSGFTIALDDFGTGYSALSYLKDFHVDLIKLDKGFVHNIQLDSTEYYLSEGMTKIAKKLNIKMVAEGIETENQFELLKEIGVDLMQGNYFSLPLIAEDFEKLMLKHTDLLDFDVQIDI